jgi:hypothetical protein
MGAQRERFGAGGRIVDSAKKFPRAVVGRGQMSLLLQRHQVLQLVGQATTAGARQERACETISLIYLDLFLAIFSRKIVGWQVYETESSELASEVTRDICAREHIAPAQGGVAL